MPPISDRSKAIKKRKKVQNLVEDEEEGAEPSINQVGEDFEMSGDEATGLAPGPLLDFEKFPEYLELTINKPANQNHLTQFNQFSLSQSLDQKTSELILLKAFPIKLNFYLVPKLKTLTLSLSSSNAQIDTILSNLIDFNDTGDRAISETEKLSATSERVYKWLHAFAGLQSNFLISQNPPEADVKSNLPQVSISAKDFVSKISQRSISASLLELQTSHMLSSRAFLPCLKTQFMKVKEFSVVPTSHETKFMLTKTPQGFNLEVQKNDLYISAQITIQPGYPVMPPTFKITLTKQPATQNEVQLSDLIAPEHLPMVESQGEAPGWCKLAPVVAQMQDELQLHYEDYCGQEQMDFLFSFQVRKLLTCFEIYWLTLNQASVEGVYETASKGRFSELPFWFDAGCGKYNQR